MGDNTQPLLMSPTQYFHEKVTEASGNLKVCLGEEMEFYIVNLLCEFITPEKINQTIGDANVLDTPLVFLMQKAEDSTNPEEKVRTFRVLGDTSLYISGYFQDYFNRKLFDIRYYMDMGSFAYRSVSELMRSRSDSSVFADLSDNFSQLVDLVAEISDEPGNSSDHTNLLALYDRWTKSNSERIRKILQEQGIDPLPMNLKVAQ